MARNDPLITFRLDSFVHDVFLYLMASRRVADWQFPNEKQARAEETLRPVQAAGATPEPGPAPAPQPILHKPLADITRRVLRAECDKCRRLVEVQTADALRLFGPHTLWKDAAMKLLEGGCQARTGNRDTDGCWPYFGNR